MKRKATLVEIITDPSGMEHYAPVHGDRPSCATCKWAEVTDSPALLECRRVYENDSPASCGIINGSHVAMEGGAASLIVAPTFGCTEWQAK